MVSLTEPGVHQFNQSSWLGSSRNPLVSTANPGIIKTQLGLDYYSGEGDLNSVLQTVMETTFMTEPSLKDLRITSH